MGLLRSLKNLRAQSVGFCFGQPDRPYEIAHFAMKPSLYLNNG